MFAGGEELIVSGSHFFDRSIAHQTGDGKGQLGKNLIPVDRDQSAAELGRRQSHDVDVDGAELFTEAPEPVLATSVQPSLAEDAADQRLVDALMRLMADERIYRHDNITIGALATKLRMPEYKLRRLINQRLDHRNFSSFVNGYRLAEATAAEVPVITIAMDAGFQSLGPFNRAFKATTGVTPTEYRRLKATAA